MWQLVAIYGVVFSAAGILALALIPSAQHTLTSYATVEATRTQDALTNLFVELSRKRVLLLHAAGPLLGACLGASVVGIPGLLVGLGVGFLAPKLVVRVVAWNRTRRFRAQLVDALLVLSSSLRAGLSLLQSLEVLSEESPPPMSQEIGLLTKETRMGLSLEEALRRLQQRMPLDELYLVVTAMLVARETGGDVTRVFAQLVETIRERHKIKERIKTLTTIPRLQGWLMAAIPFIFGSFAVKINPNYFEILIRDPVGQTVGLIAVGLWVASLALIFGFSRAPA
jgi:tight adherence protein B